MKSMWHEVRRNSPSVMPLQAQVLLERHDVADRRRPRRCAQLPPRRSPRPATARAPRAARCGRRRLPTWSARNGGVVRTSGATAVVMAAIFLGGRERDSVSGLSQSSAGKGYEGTRRHLDTRNRPKWADAASQSKVPSTAGEYHPLAGTPVAVVPGTTRRATLRVIPPALLGVIDPMKQVAVTTPCNNHLGCRVFLQSDQTGHVIREKCSSETMNWRRTFQRHAFCVSMRTGASFCFTRNIAKKRRPSGSTHQFKRSAHRGPRKHNSTSSFDFIGDGGWNACCAGVRHAYRDHLDQYGLGAVLPGRRLQ